MALINGIAASIYQDAVGVVSIPVQSGSITNLDIVAPGFTTAKSGDELTLINSINGFGYNLTLTADITSTSTRASFSSITINEYIGINSVLLHRRAKKWEYFFKESTLSHLHLYQQGNTHGNDLLMNFTQYNFNVNSGAILADGDSKNNNWGARYGFFNAPHNGAQIKKIDYIFTTNAGAGENFVFSLWKKPITPNGTTATALTLIDSYTITSQNNASYVFQSTVTPSASLGALTEHDVIIPSIKKEGTKVSSTKVYGDIELLIEYDPR